MFRANELSVGFTAQMKYQTAWLLDTAVHWCEASDVVTRSTNRGSCERFKQDKQFALNLIVSPFGRVVPMQS